MGLRKITSGVKTGSINFSVLVNSVLVLSLICSITFLSCGSEEKEEVVVVEVESNLPVSYFKDSLIEREQVVANLRILELGSDSVRFEWDGYTENLSYDYFSNYFKHVTFPSLIRLSIPADAEMKSVNVIFDQLIRANCLNLAFEVLFQGDTALVRHTLGKDDIPFNCCFERIKTGSENFDLNASYLSNDSTDVVIRNELDSFYLRNMVEIDSSYLMDQRIAIEDLSREIDSCLGVECASLFEQGQFSLRADSALNQLIGSHLRLTSSALVEFNLDEKLKFQDFIYLLSAHENWLWGKRRSLAILYFNKTYMELLDAAKRNSDEQEHVYAVRGMAPYRLRYNMD